MDHPALRSARLATTSTPVRVLRLGLHAVAAMAVVLTACSSLDSGAPPADDPAVVASTTAGPTTAPATTSTRTSATTADPAGVSFASDVMPILEANCASCHTADGPGAAHLALETAGDTDGFDADYIAAVTDVGYMPPWPADDGDVSFHGDRRLDDAALATLDAWAAQGGLLDVDPSTPIVAPHGPTTLTDVDAALTAEPYKGSVDDDIDDYRCQIYDPGIDAAGFLTGYGFEPDRTEVVHHALLFHVDAASRPAADAIAAADPDVGWGCTGLAGFGGDGETKQIMSWAPGQDPTVLPDGVGVAVAPGDFFVVQIHYHYEPAWDDLPPDESTLLLDFAEPADIAAAGGSLDPIDLTLYLGPAEIPCSTSETGPLCDRAAAVQRLLDEQGPFAGFVGDGLMALCGATADDFAGMTDGTASSTCDHPAHPGRIISIWGHEHEIGSSFRMTLNPDTPDERVLLDIPRWSFDWQLNYEPVEEIVLEAGDVIRVECAWDRSKIDHDAEPRYIVWSEGTDDEMCYSQIVTRPA